MRLQETGPLMSADLTGLDIVRNIKNELKHPIAPFLEKAVADKRLGAKTHEEQPNLREGMYVWQQANEKAVKGRRTATFIAYHKQRMQGTNPVRPTQQGLLLENNNG
jgi:3-hydroxyacyl-CoA dehydrogenase